MAPSRERTSFSSSAFACQSFQPQVTMVITSTNHGRDRSLSKPALSCSHSRRRASFRQHIGSPTAPLLLVSRDCEGWSVYQTQESVLEGENRPSTSPTASRA